MGNIREIRQRIRGIRNTQQITKAMELVAAAKVRRAQERVLATRPYAAKLREIYDKLISNLPPDYESPLLIERLPKKVGLVVFTSDKGLAGSYNINVIRLALARAREWEAKGVEVGFFAIGGKAVQVLRRTGNVINAYQGLPAIPSVSDARNLCSDLTDSFLAANVDRIELVYTRFLSMIRYQPENEALLPISIERQAGPNEDRKLYLFDPSPKEVLDRMIPKRLETVIYQAFLESAASELAARMNAMSSASKNAGDMIRSLSIVYNKARQASITQEILEVVGGADALKG